MTAGELVVGDVALPVYVINLDSRPDRWEVARARLEAHGLAPERVAALTGDAAKALDYRPVVPTRELPEWRVDQAALGCAASHIELYGRIAADDRHGAVIMEDDVVLAEDFVARASRALRTRSPHSDLVSLGWLFHEPTLRGRAADVAHRLRGHRHRDRLAVQPFKPGTHCYWVSQAFCSAAPELLQPVYAPIDAMLRAITNYSSWQSEVHWPPLAGQDDSRSDIH